MTGLKFLLLLVAAIFVENLLSPIFGYPFVIFRGILILGVLAFDEKWLDSNWYAPIAATLIYDLISHKELGAIFLPLLLILISARFFKKIFSLSRPFVLISWFFLTVASFFLTSRATHLFITAWEPIFFQMAALAAAWLILERLFNDNFKKI